MEKSIKNKGLVNSILFLILNFSLIGMSSFAHSEEVILKAGLPPFPPFSYPSDSEKQGVVDVIYERLSELSGVKFDVLHYPYPRVLESMKTGLIDVAIIFRNRSIKDHVTYVAEVSKSKVIVIPTRKLKLNTYDDLYSLQSIAVVRNANFEKRFDLDSKINKITVLDYRQGLQMMSLGRMDAIVGSQSGLEESIQSMETDTSAWGEPLVLNHKEWWIHVSNKSEYQFVIPKLRKAAQLISSENLVYRLYQELQ